MKYVIVGGGVASLGAIEGIRRHDTSGEIVVVSAEKEPIYGRPLISYLLAGKISADRLSLRSQDYYAKNGVELKLGVKAEAIDPAAKKLRLETGEEISYDQLLLATGGRPFMPPLAGLEGPDIYNFTTAEHAKTLDALAGKIKKVVVIGGGLIGLKAAEALFDRGVDVTIVELASRVLSAAFDDDAGNLVSAKLESVGLHVATSVQAKEISREANGRVKGVQLSDGRFLPAEAVVVAIGVVPESSLAKAAGLTVERGVVVDEQLRTSDPNIYCAGDVAQGKDMLYGDARVTPIWPNAYNQGFAAGRNMAGANEAFEGGLAMNSISFYGMATASVGIVNPPKDGDFEIHTVLSPENQSYRKLVFKDGRLVGYVLLGDIDLAGVYTGFIRFKLPVEGLVKEKIISGAPCALLWPEEVFTDKWNPGVQA